MNREEKQQLVEDLKDRFARAAVVILTDYKGLNVPMMSDLRRRLKEAEVEFKVVKNTLMARAAEQTPVAALGDHFRGPGAVAIAYRDPVAPAKVLTKFVEETKRLEIKVGVLNGRLIDAEGVKALAALPSREVLLGQLLAAMAAVPSGLVRALAGVPRGLLNVLAAIKEQKEAGPAAAA